MKRILITLIIITAMASAEYTEAQCKKKMRNAAGLIAFGIPITFVYGIGAPMLIGGIAMRFYWGNQLKKLAK